MKARARNSDPQTSHDAANAVERKGRAETQRKKCLHIVMFRPGLTAAEIAGEAGMERHVPSRRLPELRDAGWVRNGESRECRVVGNSSMTWYPVDADPQMKLC